MSHLTDIVDFMNREKESPFIIEPAYRLADIRERITDVLDTYNPKVIVKAGLGSPELVREIAEKGDALLVIVDPSADTLCEFQDRHRGEKFMDRVRFIAGDFHEFPVDYYKANLLICADCLEFTDASKVLDEFRRSLDFENLLILAGTVLHDDDLDGVYDDFRRLIFPLHNDYYLRDDLKTFVELKDFSHVKSTVVEHRKDLAGELDRLASLFPGISREGAGAFIDEHREAFRGMYGLGDDGLVTEHYYIGLFRKNKYVKPDDRI